MIGILTSRTGHGAAVAARAALAGERAGYITGAVLRMDGGCTRSVF
jgi:hypothetical protein